MLIKKKFSIESGIFRNRILMILLIKSQGGIDDVELQEI